MSSLLIFLFLIFYLILAYTKLDWAVMFLIAALPAYLIRFDVLGIPFTLLEAMILISFAVWFFGNYKNIIRNIKQKLKIENWKLKIGNRYPFDVEIVLLLIISFAAAGVAGLSASAMGIWKAYFFEPALLYILVFNVFGKHTNGTNPEHSGRKESNDGSIVPLGLWSRIANRYKQFASRLHSPATAGTMEPAIFNIEKILWPLAVSAFVVSVLAIYQKFTGAFIFNELWAAEETRRVTSFFGYPNAVGLYLGPIIFILLGWIFDQYSEIKSKNLRQDIKEIFNFQFSPAAHCAAGQAIFNKFSIFPGRAPRSGAGNFQFFKILFICLTIIVSLLSIYFAKSEGALIGVAAGLVLFGLLAGKKIRWAAIILILSAVIGIINSQPASPWLQRGEPLRDYAVKKITLTDLSGEIRKQQWRETWQMLAASPLRFAFGAGLANYKNAVVPYHQEGIFFNRDNDPEFHRHVVWDEEYKKSHWQPTEIYLYPHNIILNFWTELGLAGLLLFIWIIGKYFWIGIFNFQTNSKFKIQNFINNDFKYINIGLMCAMVVIIIHGFVDVPYFKNDLAAMFWLLIAMIGFMDLESRRGARVVESGALEKRCALTGTEGSNPSLSANIILCLLFPIRLKK